MNINIHVDENVTDMEVSITCKELTPKVEKMLATLRMMDRQLTASKAGEVYMLDISRIMYIETVDRKSFIYTSEDVYESEFRLYELEKISIPAKLKVPVIVTIISGIGFSLSGIILALVLKADVMKSASDPFAFVVMAVALVIVFFLTKYYVQNKSAITTVIYYVICYAVLAGLPTAYNYMTGSLLKSPLSLIFSGLPVVAIAVYMIISNNKKEH